MDNIFEGAEFGDKFVTRDGRIVIYWGYKIPEGRDITWHYLISDSIDVALYCTEDGLAVGNHTDFPEWDTDIVSKYQEPIDEDKLDELANKEEFNHLIVDNLYEYTEYEGYKIKMLMKDMYKASYRKAMEEKI